MTKPATLPQAVTLPTWTDSASVTAYISSAVTLVVSTLAAVHPGFHEPAIVAQFVPIVGVVVAGAFQAINVFTHRSTQKAAILVKASAGVTVTNTVTK